MCIANAYLIRHGEQELLMENVDTVQAVDTDVWNLTGLLGEEKQIKARIICLQLIDNRLLFEEII